MSRFFCNNTQNCNHRSTSIPKSAGFFPALSADQIPAIQWVLIIALSVSFVGCFTTGFSSFIFFIFSFFTFHHYSLHFMKEIIYPQRPCRSTGTAFSSRGLIQRERSSESFQKCLLPGNSLPPLGFLAETAFTKLPCC